MRAWAVVVILALSLSAGASRVHGQASTPQDARQPYMPGLGEFMLGTQTRHHKLWLAGNAGNWELADYEIDELKEGLEDAAKYVPTYKDMLVGQMIESTILKPIAEVETAIKARDRSKFTATFDELTLACNACHQAANRPFIVVQRPSGSNFPNQSFAPRSR
jgi:hypothetical protein